MSDNKHHDDEEFSTEHDGDFAEFEDHNNHEESFDDEHEGNHYHAYDDNNEEEAEETHEENEEDKTEEKKSGISKLLMPVGGGVLALFVAYFGYTHFLSGSNNNQQVASNVQPTFAHPPTIPNASIASNGLPNNIPNINRPLPVPSQNTAPVINNLPGRPNGMVMPPSANTGNINNAVDNKDENLNGTSKVETSLLQLVDLTKNLDQTLSKRFDDIDNNIAQTKQVVNDRLDKTDSNVSQVATHVQSIDTKLEDFDTRLKNIESGSIHIKKAVEATNNKERSQDNRRNRSYPAIKEHKDRIEVAKSNAVSGYILRGIEKVPAGHLPHSAWIQTPGGFILAKVGQNAGHLGTIKAIVPRNGNWVVETSAGLVNP